MISIVQTASICDKLICVWCISDVPRVFDGKACAHDEHIRVIHVWCATCIFDGKTCTHDEVIRVVHHVWLTCVLMTFACVVHV